VTHRFVCPEADDKIVLEYNVLQYSIFSSEDLPLSPPTNVQVLSTMYLVGSNPVPAITVPVDNICYGTEPLYTFVKCMSELLQT
jgi:hypothetical protein